MVARVAVASGLLLAQLAHALEELRLDQDLARLAAVGRADDAVLLHHVDQPRRPRVAQLQAALDVGHGNLSHLDGQAYCLVVGRIDVLVTPRGTAGPPCGSSRVTVSSYCGLACFFRNDTMRVASTSVTSGPCRRIRRAEPGGMNSMS